MTFSTTILDTNWLGRPRSIAAALLESGGHRALLDPGPASTLPALRHHLDFRGLRTCAQYDALNRQTVLNYSNGDPTITTTYDQSNCLGLSTCQNIGHATNTTDAAGSESWAYQTDSANLRSVHVNQRTVSSVSKTTTYVLDLAGNTTQVTYPTGRIVNFTFDAANRPATAVDSANGTTYAAAQSTPPTGCLTTGVCYTPQGSEYSATIGKTSTFTGVNISETYNTRLQPLEIKASSTAGNAFDISYSFVDPTSLGNAGLVNSITNNLNSSRTQSFAYDHLDRIVTAGTTATSGTYCWGYQYNYDAWANLLAQTGWSPNYNGCSEATMGSVNADGNNHISGFTYDASGNTQNDGTIAYTYDAESQIKTAAGVTYLYDGSGRRVSKSNGKLYWYGSGGEILAETDASGNPLNEYIFFAGKRVAVLPAGGNPEYYAEDFLGSSRVMTQNNGTVCYDADFDPYGGEHAYTNNCPSANSYKFEGKERDTETGNDDFGARYYSNRFGRWLSADWSSVPVPVPYANLSNPQTLNLYAMVSDDPESFADLDGHADDDIVDHILNFVVSAGATYLSDNFFGAFRPSPKSPEGTFGQAVGDFAAQQSGIAEAEAGAAGLASAPETAMVPEVGPGGAAIQATVSEAAVLHGTATAAIATVNLVKDAQQTSSGGPKAKDAPGVSAGGQATDEHGNKLGPSGDTQVNRTRSNTREGANNRARDQGSRTVEHRNPKQGKPHFHPADKQGKKKPSSTHHEYPD